MCALSPGEKFSSHITTRGHRSCYHSNINETSGSDRKHGIWIQCKRLSFVVWYLLGKDLNVLITGACESHAAAHNVRKPTGSLFPRTNLGRSFKFECFTRKTNFKCVNFKIPTIVKKEKLYCCLIIIIIIIIIIC